MKVNKARQTIRLGGSDTRKWEDSGSSGDSFRRSVRMVAERLANASGKSVEIYASDKAGGWMADQVCPDPDLAPGTYHALDRFKDDYRGGER